MKKEDIQSNRSQLSCRRMSHKGKPENTVREKTGLNLKGTKVRLRAASQQQWQAPWGGGGGGDAAPSMLQVEVCTEKSYHSLQS